MWRWYLQFGHGFGAVDNLIPQGRIWFLVPHLQFGHGFGAVDNYGSSAGLIRVWGTLQFGHGFGAVDNVGSKSLPRRIGTTFNSATALGPWITGLRGGNSS